MTALAAKLVRQIRKRGRRMDEGGTASPASTGGGYSYGGYAGAGNGNGAGSPSYSSSTSIADQQAAIAAARDQAARGVANAEGANTITNTIGAVLSPLTLGLSRGIASIAHQDPWAAGNAAMFGTPTNSDVTGLSQTGSPTTVQGNTNMSDTTQEVNPYLAFLNQTAANPTNISLEAKLAELNQVPGLTNAISGQMGNIQAGGVGTDLDVQQTANNALLSGLASGDNTNSQAARQLQQTTQQNAAAAAGAMASARGLTPAQAARLVLNQQAAGGQQAAGQAANLRSNEQIAASNALTSALSNQRAGRTSDISAATSAAGTLGGLNTSQNQLTLQNQEQTQNFNLDVAKANQTVGAAAAEGNANRAVQMRAQDIGVDAANQTRNDQLLGAGLNAAGAIAGAVLAEGGRAGESGLDMAIAGRNVDSMRNDTVPAMLSAGEGVIPKSIMEKDNAPELAAAFVAGIKSIDKGLPPDDSYGGVLARNRARGDEISKIDSELMAFGGRVKPMLRMSEGGSVDDGLYRRFIRWLQSSKDDGAEAGQDVARSLNAALPEAVSGANLVRANKRLTDQLDGISRMADGGPVWGGLGSTPLVDPGPPVPAVPPTNDELRQLDMLRRQRELELLTGGTTPPYLDSAPGLRSAPSVDTATVTPSKWAAMAPGAVPDTSGIPVNGAELTPPAPRAAPSVAPSMAPTAPSVPQFGIGPSTIGQGIGEQQKAIEEQAAARSDQAAQQKAIYERGIADQKAIADAADQERSAIQKRMSTTRDAIVAGDVKPDHYWQEKGTFGRVSSAIAIALSGIGQGLAGGENLALKTINQAIDRDIDAQKNNLQKNTQLYGADQGDLQANVALENHMRARALGSVEAQVQMATAQAKTKEEKANGRLLMGQLEIQKNQLMQDSAIKKAQIASTNMELQKAGEQTRQLRDYQAWKEQGIKDPAAMQDREWLTKGQLNGWLPQGAGGGGVTTYVQETRKDVLGNPVNRVVPIQVRPASKEAETKLRESAAATQSTLAQIDALEAAHSKGGKWVPFSSNRGQWKTELAQTVGTFKEAFGYSRMTPEGRKQIEEALPGIEDGEEETRTKLQVMRQKVLDKSRSDAMAYGAQ